MWNSNFIKNMLCTSSVVVEYLFPFFFLWLQCNQAQGQAGEHDGIHIKSTRHIEKLIALILMDKRIVIDFYK